MLAGIFFLAFGGFSRSAPPTTSFRDDPVELVEGGSFAGPLNQDWSNNAASLKIVPVKGPGFSSALHIETSPTSTSRPWDVGLHARTSHLVHLGDTVLIRAWMRGTASGQDSAFRVGLVFEQSTDPFTKLIEAPVVLGSEWKEYRFAATAATQYLPGEAQFTMYLGYGSGSLEIASLRVEDMGDTPPASLHQTIDMAVGKKDDKSWRAAALARIDKFRKAPVVVQIVGSDGKPLRGAQVEVEQTSSEFRFGTAAPAALITGSDADSRQFQTVLARDFNTVTFENDLKWNSLESPNYEEVDRAIDWLQRHNFKIRGHNLVWGSQKNLPSGLWDLRDDQIKAKLERRVKEVVTRFRGKIYLWDVVNEAVTEHALWDRLGLDEFSQVYKLARQADPSVLLAYNDYNITEEAAAGEGQRRQIIQKVRALIDSGAPLDVVGMQCHVGPPMTSISRVVQIVESMAKLGKRLEVTEYDLGVLDDKVHSEYSRDFLTAMFSEPSVDGFIVWGFWEGSQWRAAQGGAIYRKDWTPRPTATEWEKLVLHDWRTNLKLSTDSAGQARMRAFLGTYRITAKVNKQSVTATATVSSRGENTITIKL